VKSGVVYEISVRMEDGSMRIMTESNPPTWRAGDERAFRRQINAARLAGNSKTS
jgi:hypothetical protein